MKRILTVILLMGMASSVRAWADAPATSQPSNATLINELELQANEDMGRKDWAAAAVLLQKVESLLTDQPDQQAPIMEQLRVCRHQILNATNDPTKAGSVVIA